MSELTPCNWCSLQRIIEKHQRLPTDDTPGRYVSLRAARPEWIEVWLVDRDQYGVESNEQRAGVAFCQLSTTCVC